VPLNFKNPVLRSGFDKSLLGGMPEFPRVNTEMVQLVRLEPGTPYPSSWIRVLCAQHLNPIHPCPGNFVLGWSLTDLNDAALTQIPFLIRPKKTKAVLEGGFWNIHGCEHAIDLEGRETKTPPRGKCVTQ